MPSMTNNIQQWQPSKIKVATLTHYSEGCQSNCTRASTNLLNFNQISSSFSQYKKLECSVASSSSLSRQLHHLNSPSMIRISTSLSKTRRLWEDHQMNTVPYFNEKFKREKGPCWISCSLYSPLSGFRVWGFVGFGVS